MYTFIKLLKNTQNPLRILAETPTCSTLSQVETSILTVFFYAKQVFYRQKRACFCTFLHNFCEIWQKTLHIFVVTMERPRERDKRGAYLHNTAVAVTRRAACVGSAVTGAAFEPARVAFERPRRAVGLCVTQIAARVEFGGGSRGDVVAHVIEVESHSTKVRRHPNKCCLCDRRSDTSLKRLTRI